MIGDEVGNIGQKGHATMRSGSRGEGNVASWIRGARTWNRYGGPIRPPLANWTGAGS